MLESSDEVKMKKKNLSLAFGLRLGVEIVVLIAVLSVATIFAVQNGMEKTYITSTTELIQAHIQGLGYRNSKFMQQLRMYTMADPVQNEEDVQALIDWITSHRKIRSSDFTDIAFCDYETGLSYSDDGTVKNVADTEYFKFMKSESQKEKGKSQYVSNPLGSNNDDAAYYVCKSVSIDKKAVGFVAGAVSHARLAEAIDAIKIGESGYAMLLAGDGTIMAFPDHSLVMRENFARANSNFEGVSQIANAMISGESGNGWVQGKNGKELMVYAPVSGTPWSMAMCVPGNQVFSTSRALRYQMAIFAIGIAIILIITSAISVFRMLKPLRVLDKNLNGIASGNADLTQRIKVHTNDDIGSVTNGFNTFVEKLHSGKHAFGRGHSLKYRERSEPNRKSVFERR